MHKPILSMQKISKKFGSVYALQNVDLEIYPGEVHALLGENGAGKSTLMKILSGVHIPTEGDIIIGEGVYSSISPQQAKDHGIAIIYQELSVIDELSVLENLFVGHLPTKKGMPICVDWHKMETKAKAIFEKMGIELDLYMNVEELSISYKQMLEIAKALLMDAKLVIMDEPTSSLTSSEIDALFKIIDDLKKQGTAIVYISHKLAEIQQIANRYTVLKDGQTIETGLCEGKSNTYYVQRMVGRDVQHNYVNPNPDAAAKTLLEVKNISARRYPKIQDVSFDVKAGEIIGFFGIVGSGRTELMNCLFGADKITQGQILFDGYDITPRSPLHAVKNGIAYVTENRRKTGFFDNFSIGKNIIIPKALRDSPLEGMYGRIKAKEEQAIMEHQATRFSVKCEDIEQNITELSGGNQQKVIIAKWMAMEPKLIIFDEPTRGIDVGAKSEIYNIMRKLAEHHVAVVMVSSELPEILAVCDRIAIFAEGEIVDILSHHEATEDKIMHLALKQHAEQL